MKFFILSIFLMMGMVSANFAANCQTTTYSVPDSQKPSAWANYCIERTNCGSSGMMIKVPTPAFKDSIWQVSCECCGTRN